ncbi:MAG TPA: class II fructose-bisphosphate aldolase, partial [Candidatus Paceibacterota bacterium]|nr:class II fructose-bisphosphate aldolase [Candidatus Paceibacterota bacterium]
DHHYSFETVKAAVDAGYDSVIFDGAKLSFEENIKQSRRCMEYVKHVNKHRGTDVLLEVELGYIGQGSELRDKIPDGIAVVTKPEDAKRFIAETEADMFAPAVGNFHGMLRNGAKPRLNIDCIKHIAQTVNVPLVLHGGSGEDADYAAAIDAGISIIHVNTQLRTAYTNALRAYMNAHPDDIAPYKYATNATLAMERVVEEKLKLFNRIK